MFKRKQRVTMRASVGDYVAGHTYKLSASLADSYIVKGYADGSLSRAYGDDEKNALRSQVQVVSFDG